MSESKPAEPGSAFHTRNRINGYTVICLDCSAPWWWPRRRDTPWWWPLVRVVPTRRRPRPPQPVSIEWVRCDGDAGVAAMAVIAAQNRHVTAHRRHRTHVRESGVMTFHRDAAP